MRALVVAKTELTAFAASLAAIGTAVFVVALGAGLYADLPAVGLAVGAALSVAAAVLLAWLAARGFDRTEASEADWKRVEPRSRSILRTAALSPLAAIGSAVAFALIALMVAAAFDRGSTSARSVAIATTLLEAAWLVIFAGRQLGLAIGIRRQEARLGVTVLVAPLRAGQRGAGYYTAAGSVDRQ